MSTFDYDVIVIGCGSAGSRAAVAAHQYGARTLAIDSGEELGGLCILRGCMPTKTLLETAHRLHDIRDAHRFGIEVADPKVDFPAHMARMRQLVARFKSAKIRGIEKGGYELRQAPVHFLDEHTVDVGGSKLRSKAFVIATGSSVRPFPIPVPDDVSLATSDDMFKLESIPKRAIVVGAGAVGLEFATWLSRLGSEVTLTTRSRLLHQVDLDMGEDLAGALGKEMRLVLPANLEKLEKKSDGTLVLTVSKSDGVEHLEGDMILDAVGRVPNFEGLELKNAGIETQGLKIGDSLQSSKSHILFAGDAAGRRLILHEANIEGRLAGVNAAKVAAGRLEDVASYDHSVPPVSVIFTDPAFATVGLSTVECQKRGIPFSSALKEFSDQGRGIVMGQEHGLLRLIVHKETRKVLGCQILNTRADDLIHIPAAVILMGGHVDEMFRIPWYHPTLAEAFIEVCRELAS